MRPRRTVNNEVAGTEKDLPAALYGGVKGAWSVKVPENVQLTAIWSPPLNASFTVTVSSTSKEVAATLFLSPRTIDAHLRNIYSKLEITSRRELRNL
jgi:hypothetical protein